MSESNNDSLGFTKRELRADRAAEREFKEMGLRANQRRDERLIEKSREDRRDGIPIQPRSPNRQVGVDLKAQTLDHLQQSAINRKLAQLGPEFADSKQTAREELAAARIVREAAEERIAKRHEAVREILGKRDAGPVSQREVLSQGR